MLQNRNGVETAKVLDGRASRTMTLMRGDLAGLTFSSSQTRHWLLIGEELLRRLPLFMTIVTML